MLYLKKPASIQVASNSPFDGLYALKGFLSVNPFSVEADICHLSYLTFFTPP